MSETTARVLQLLNLLQTHRQWSGAELRGRLGVTERTLRRDIERLRELGYEVAATRGVAGGYRLEAGATLPPLLLTDDEAVTMAIGLRIAATQGLADGEHTTLAALAKFEQVLPAHLRRRVNALSGVVRSPTPYTASVPQELIGQLALACRDRERIRFRYLTPAGVESSRVVEPHSLVAADRAWFLLCWDRDRDDWRTFRLDRMSGYFGTRLRFEQRGLPGGDPAAFLARSIGTVQKRFSADIVLGMPLALMQEQFGQWSSGATSVSPNETRWPIAGTTIELLFGMIAWIPLGVSYRIENNDELRAFARDQVSRLSEALR
jgi:biotin operon repressor